MNNKHDVYISSDSELQKKDKRILQSALQALSDSSIPAYCVNIYGHFMGMNAIFFNIIDATYHSNPNATTLDSFCSKATVQQITKDCCDVIATGMMLAKSQDVHLIATSAHQPKRLHLHTTYMPLHGADQKIIGVTIVCNRVQNKVRKQQEIDQEQRVFNQLESIANTIPAPFYWSDLNYRCMGANDLTLEAIGIKSCPEKLIGHTVHNIYAKDIADAIINNQRKVIETKKPLIVRESVTNIAGVIKHYEATIAPLYDHEGKVVGTYGISMDITAEQEAEQLRLKDQVHQIESEQQEKFKRIVSQAVHDINSPLATMRMILSSCADKIPERPRVALHQVAGNIQAISGGLLANWSVKKQRQEKRADTGKGGASEPIILAAIAFSEVLTNKRFEYQKSSIQLRDYVLPSSYFTVIHGDAVDFKRMLSNIINNATGAYENGRGEIRCTLMDKDDQVILCVSDKGKGIPEDVLNKIRQAIRVSSGKEEGHGIGFTQIHDTVKQLQGSIDIESTVGKGTQISLQFPCIPKPDWLADGLTLRSDDTIVILDDDESIHQAWKDRFQKSDLQPYLDKHTVHFTQGQEAVDYINQAEDKDKLFLLTDYELLKQALNGIQVIEKTGLKRTVLVTSHHDNISVREGVIKVGTQLLPKQLAHEVPIHIDVTVPREQQPLEGIIAENRDRSMLGTKKVGI